MVVPVREGFHNAVSHYLETKKVYNGLGQPTVNDPLYFSIIDEIKERNDANKEEIPVGDPWETRLPTSAIIVSKTEELPTWEKVPGEDWAWKPS